MSVYNILIVDDMASITNMVASYLAEDKSLDLNIFKAYSGVEAMEILKDNQMDILLSDVEMPDMSGLELHERNKMLWPECRTIFLTAFDKFEKIQAALRGEAVDFILKSEGKSIIVQSIKNAILRIEHERGIMSVSSRTSLNTLRSNIPRLRQMVIEDAIYGRYDPDYIDYTYLNIALDPHEDVFLVLGKVAPTWWSSGPT